MTGPDRDSVQAAGAARVQRAIHRGVDLEPGDDDAARLLMRRMRWSNLRLSVSALTAAGWVVLIYASLREPYRHRSRWALALLIQVGMLLFTVLAVRRQLKLRRWANRHLGPPT